MLEQELHESLHLWCLQWHLTCNMHSVDIFEYVNELWLHVVTEAPSLCDQVHMKETIFII